jgi:ketosteroid isomerase-like protein
MSEKNVDLVRRYRDAYNMRDIEAMLACCDPNIEHHAAWPGVAPAVYHGHDGMRKWHRENHDAWGEELRLEPEAGFDLGDTLLRFYVVHGRGQQSGVEVAMPAATVLRVRDGLIVYMKTYTDREEALRDLGVSEDELEPIEP